MNNKKHSFQYFYTKVAPKAYWLCTKLWKTKKVQKQQQQQQQQNNTEFFETTFFQKKSRHSLFEILTLYIVSLMVVGKIHVNYIH